MNENKNTFLTRKERRALKHEEKAYISQQRQNKRLFKRILVWICIFIAIGLGIFGLVKLSDNLGSSGILMYGVSPVDQVQGNPDASVVLLEYSDFQCPGCALYHSIPQPVMEEFNDRLLFAYRHFPLKNVHKNANNAAKAAEAAGRQGKFWEMGDMIFLNQRDWSLHSNVKNVFTDYARTLDLDIEKFTVDINSDEVEEKVDNDYKSGIQSGVNATPTFFLNGKKMENVQSYEEFKSIIEQAIAENTE